MILLPPRATRTYTLFPNTTLFLSLPYKILGSLLSLNGCCLMDDDRLAEFMQFSRKHRHKFKRIAKATRNECEHDDVQNEAWILAEHWEQAGTPIDFENQKDKDKKIGRA